MSHLLNAAQIAVSKRHGVVRRAVAQNQLLSISGKTVAMSEVCELTGLTTRAIRKKYRNGKREWADYGVTR